MSGELVTRDAAVRGVIDAVAAEGRRLDELKRQFARLYDAVMALVGIDMMPGNR